MVQVHVGPQFANLGSHPETTAELGKQVHRWLRKMGSESVGAIPFLSMLVTGQIGRGDLDGAMASAAQINALAQRVGDDRNRCQPPAPKSASP